MDQLLKTLGPQGARLVTGLHERGRTLFSNADVEEITGLGPKSARNFVAALVRRGGALAARLLGLLVDGAVPKQWLLVAVEAVVMAVAALWLWRFGP